MVEHEILSEDESALLRACSWRSSSAAPWVVVCNAVGVPLEAIRPFCERLSGVGLNVATWESRGCRSTGEGHGVRCSTTDCRSDFKALCRAFDVTSPHVVGWSTGAHVALGLPGLDGTGVQSLTCVSGAFPSRGLEAGSFLEHLRIVGDYCARDPGRAASLRALAFPSATHSSTAADDESDGAVTIMGQVVPRELAYWVSYPFREQRRFDAYCQHLESWYGESPESITPGVAVPTLFLHGDVDPIAPREFAEHVARLVPQALFRSLPGANHYAIQDSRSGVVEEIAQHVYRARARSRGDGGLASAGGAGAAVSQSQGRALAYDVIGVGFGPANMSVAVALLEGAAGKTAASMRFLEGRENADWHPGLMLPGVTMQISFLKDLATQRNPRSHFSYLNFLKLTGRMESFVNIRRFHPLRVEFAEYLRWVASELGDFVDYSHHVQAIEAVPAGNGRVDWLRVRAHGPRGETSYLCRNVVLSVGGKPRLMEGCETVGDKVVHSSEFLPRLRASFPDRERPYRFAVAGAGQSAAEMLLYLYREYPRAQVVGILRGFALKQSDSSSFINELFNHHSVDVAFSGNPYVRRAMLERSTNNGVVDVKELSELYDAIYLDRFFGAERLRFSQFREVLGVRRGGDGVIVEMKDLARNVTREEPYDALFLGTGFWRELDHPALAGIRDQLLFDGRRPRIQRDYRLTFREGFNANVFVQGASEEEHGISNTLLSSMAFRAGEIADVVHTTCAAHPMALTAGGVPE